MKQTRIIMGMPVTIEIVSLQAGSVSKILEEAFDYFTYVDQKFSTYKADSEIMKLNRGEIKFDEISKDMREILELAEKTKNETMGYFNITDRRGLMDPSGIVKGWAIHNAAKLIKNSKFENYYVEAGGDIQVNGTNSEGKKWAIGIKNPFKQNENVKVAYLRNQGIATSGTYIRGQHIYNPHDKNEVFNDIVSLTVIGPNIYEADRFATAAFAMGRKGIEFIEMFNYQYPISNEETKQTSKLEAYMIDSKGTATMTTGFMNYEL